MVTWPANGSAQMATAGSRSMPIRRGATARGDSSLSDGICTIVLTASGPVNDLFGSVSGPIGSRPTPGADQKSSRAEN